MTTDEMVTDVAPTDSSTPPDTTQEVVRADPQFVAALVASIIDWMKYNQQDNEAELVYITVRQAIRHTQTLTSSHSDVVPLIFTYYLEVYRAYFALKDQAQIPLDDPRTMKLYHQAALALFDLYVSKPSDLVLRRLLTAGVIALSEVVVNFYESDESRTPEELFGDLTTMSVFTQTVSLYTRSVRRTKNLDYICWLKNFFVQALAGKLLTSADPVLTSVFDQVNKRSKIITIPTS
jgi:hypothetical protein